ncbi:hypothetical protein KP004_14490 [Geomonas oryzisoli]|uniref:Lipoprotein SmpA/OmlA domain-containing protein n=1 Tax=Geomonas oryzisoli TaxID=2847992 RepID=A0ABX8J5W7_9BACT|nr:hypothetical protein [Geomonas oryzisoli]QWV92407.1 hypothetical protein KP004_14490 [Geomonas oryzisoli]
MKKLLLVLAALLVAACAHAPAQSAKEAGAKTERNFSPAHVKEVIVKGKTTQKEILAKIGTPNSVKRRSLGVTTGPAEVWNYWTAPPLNDVAKGGLQPVTSLAVVFDDNGVVQDYAAADSSVLIQ